MASGRKSLSARFFQRRTSATARSRSNDRYASTSRQARNASPSLKRKEASRRSPSPRRKEPQGPKKGPKEKQSRRESGNYSGRCHAPCARIVREDLGGCRQEGWNRAGSTGAQGDPLGSVRAR